MSVSIKFESHSTTIDNEAEKASGWYDVGLSELGRQQAQNLGERNKEESFDAIFCSDLQRSYETARIAFGDRDDIKIFMDWRLREADYGEMTQGDAETVKAEKSKRISEPFPGGESYEQTTTRIESFLEDLRKFYDDKRVMVIGHRATQYGLESLILEKSLDEIVPAPWSWQPGWEYELK
ncbi:MAG: histidine phosphatase family protein [bacterium]